MKKLIGLVFLLMSFCSFSLDKVQVSCYVINMGEFSIVTGNFVVDFYLTLKTAEKPEYPLETFEIMNGKVTSMEKIQDTPNLKQYRIKANLNSPVNLKNFPFDTQQLKIIIENKVQTSNKVVYVPLTEESSLDSLINFSGWKIIGWSVQEEKHVYSVFKEEYSSYSFQVTIGKIIWNAFFKTFVPVLITMLIIAATYAIPIDKVKSRFDISVQSLIATVMFHVSISNQIPPVSYMTIADKFMMLTYLILLSTFILNIYLMQLYDKGNKELTMSIYKKTEYTMFFIIPLIYILFFVTVSLVN